MRVGRALLGLLLVLASSCGVFPQKVTFDDPRLKPLFRAMSAAGAQRTGFSLVHEGDDIRIETASRKKYDVMLHIYGASSKTVAFKKDGDALRWIGEQEIFEGPERYDTPDGIQPEQICITYDLEPVSGAPLKKLYITYHYPDKDGKPAYRGDLNLSEAQKLIRSWAEKRGSK